MKEKGAILRYLSRNDLMSFSPRAALVDMDGTLYDSMPNHAEAWSRLMSEVGINCTKEEFFLYEGRTGVDTIKMLFKRGFGQDVSLEYAKELYHRKTEFFSSLPPVNPMPGAAKMINILRNVGLETVLVTGSGQNSLLNRLDHDFPGAFPSERRITSRHVTKGKPDPEPFLKAMAIVGVTPENAIAIDNAPIGVMAGSASGAFTIGVVTGPIPESSLVEAGADIVYESMEELAARIHILLDCFEFSI